MGGITMMCRRSQEKKIDDGGQGRDAPWSYQNSGRFFGATRIRSVARDLICVLLLSSPNTSWVSLASARSAGAVSSSGAPFISWPGLNFSACTCCHTGADGQPVTEGRTVSRGELVIRGASTSSCADVTVRGGSEVDPDEQEPQEASVRRVDTRGSTSSRTRNSNPVVLEAGPTSVDSFSELLCDKTAAAASLLHDRKGTRNNPDAPAGHYAGTRRMATPYTSPVPGTGSGIVGKGLGATESGSSTGVLDLQLQPTTEQSLRSRHEESSCCDPGRGKSPRGDDQRQVHLSDSSSPPADNIPGMNENGAQPLPKRNPGAGGLLLPGVVSKRVRNTLSLLAAHLPAGTSSSRGAPARAAAEENNKNQNNVRHRRGSMIRGCFQNVNAATPGAKAGKNSAARDHRWDEVEHVPTTTPHSRRSRGGVELTEENLLHARPEQLHLEPQTTSASSWGSFFNQDNLLEDTGSPSFNLRDEENDPEDDSSGDGTGPQFGIKIGRQQSQAASLAPSASTASEESRRRRREQEYQARGMNIPIVTL
ncbi:unnamed protein product [Amoebophrya sp. A120]|nr:unnamed protein product [Amoebophrya sp. A120]|eukprot:GSA120T00017893001.1